MTKRYKVEATVLGKLRRGKQFFLRLNVRLPEDTNLLRVTKQAFRDCKVGHVLTLERLRDGTGHEDLEALESKMLESN
jgi:hypothetical protein